VGVALRMGRLKSVITYRKSKLPNFFWLALEVVILAPRFELSCGVGSAQLQAMRLSRVVLSADIGYNLLVSL